MMLTVFAGFLQNKKRRVRECESGRIGNKVDCEAAEGPKLDHKLFCFCKHFSWAICKNIAEILSELRHMVVYGMLEN